MKNVCVSKTSENGFTKDFCLESLIKSVFGLEPWGVYKDSDVDWTSTQRQRLEVTNIFYRKHLLKIGWS